MSYIKSYNLEAKEKIKNMKKEYKILLLASMIVNFGDNLIGPFYAVFVENIGGSILDIGYTITVYSVATGILMILVGKISDKLNRELITIFGYLIFALGSLGYILISTPGQLFVLQIFFAMGTAMLAAPISSLYAKYVQKKEAGFQWGLESGGTQIILGLSIFFGTFIIRYAGFKTLFIMMFLFQLAGTLVQSKLYFESKKLKYKRSGS